MHINTYDAHYGIVAKYFSLVYTGNNNTAHVVKFQDKLWRANAGMTNITYSQYSDVRMGARIFLGHRQIRWRITWPCVNQSRSLISIRFANRWIRHR